MENNKSYQIRTIGLLEGKEINIRKEYIRGLKQLENFSHVHIFWKRYENNGVGLSTAEIEFIDHKNGTVKIKNCRLTDACILDIKPYLPCDDTVRDTGGKSQLPENYYSDVSKDQNDFEITRIGSIKTTGKKNYIDILPQFSKEIDKLKGCNYINVIWFFNRLDNPVTRKMLVCTPPYDAPKTGVFACRAPVRPNPLALSVCRIKNIDIKNLKIEISSTDALDGTPVIDIKPYVDSEDRITVAEVPSWISHWPRFIIENSKQVSASEIKHAEIYTLKNYLADEKKVRKSGTLKKSVYKRSANKITLYGARQHNLKNITVSFPVGRTTVITGVSGSGKSSLAFDTLYAEGQRRYMQSFSAGSAFHPVLEKPDFDSIQNLLPVVAVEQKKLTQNPRMTVGTVSDIYSYLRLLFAKIGTRHCSKCGREILPVSAETLTGYFSRLVEGTEIMICPGKNPKGEKDKYKLTSSSCKNNYGEIRKIISGYYLNGNGFITLQINNDENICVTDRSACTSCNAVYFKMTASMFSYNSPSGMCGTCKGLGKILDIDPDRVISDPQKSLLDEASPWYGNLRKHMQKPNANWYKSEVLALAEDMNVDLELPWEKLPEEFRKTALYGSGEKEYIFTYKSPKTGRSGTIKRPVGGAVNNLRKLFKNSKSGNSHELYRYFLEEKLCPDCNGERLSEDGRYVTIAGCRYPEAASLSIGEFTLWLSEIELKLPELKKQVAGEIISELKLKLNELIKTGLYYLPLDRSVTTLSGGEAQRLRLAGQLGCGLSGLLYILDEPSTGLHAKDHKNMINILSEIRDVGNTVIIVEHDMDTILSADHIIDMGPGAGHNGGKIIAQGSIEDIKKNEDSLTGKYLREKKNYKRNKKQLKADNYLELNGAALFNLKNVSVKIPLSRLTCITGVSGSGKSSLIQGILVPAVIRKLKGMEIECGKYKSIKGLSRIDKIINVDQTAIGRSSRSIPATYIGVFDEIRNVFAETEQAAEKGFLAGRFSFNDKKGQCRTCEGRGRIRIDMSFLPDAWVTCRDCEGKRYNEETLSVYYKDKNISDVLNMDASEAYEFFKDQKKIIPYLKTLNEVGLDYLNLGQSSVHLSGGEAQRIKLALELSRQETGNTLYVLDEPTSGLHFSDTEKLLKVLHRLCSMGNTVIIIEHNLDVVKTADWIIDLGPEGGDRGGYLVGQGTPDEIIKIRESYTGQYLKNVI